MGVRDRELRLMNEQRQFGRWLVIGIVTMVALASGAFVATRPLVQMRIPRAVPPFDETGKPDPVVLPPSDSPWIDGDGTATASGTYPVKVNERSGIYHLVGDLAYDRTVSTKNYRTAEAAEADGFRHALR
jgi:hypothetical protein